jgi:ABC-2 type transport system permease protein
MIDTLRDTTILARLRLRIFSRLILPRFTAEAQRSAPYRLTMLVLLGSSFLFLVSMGLGFLLSRSLHGQVAGSYLFPAFVWAPTAAMIGIFFYAVLSVIGTFTYRNDLTSLMLTPISPRLVLTDKLLAVSMSFSALLLIVGFPELIGAGRSLHAGLTFDLAAFLVVVLIPIAPVALATLLTIVVLRWLPPASARSATVVFGMAAAAALYIGSDSLGRVTITVPSGHWSLIPTTWPGQALVAAAQGHNSVVAVYLGASVLFAVGMTALAVDRSAHLLASGWTIYHEVGRRRRVDSRSTAREGRLRAISQRLSWRPALWPLLRKEWLTVRRDPKLLAQLVYPLVIEGYTFYRAFGNPFTAHPVTGRLVRYFASLLYISTSLTALFLLTILALPIISREGRSLYLLGMLPVRARDVLLAKVIFCLVPVLVLTEWLLVFVAARLLVLSWQQTLFSALVLGALVTALACWLVCVGLIWPRLSSDQSRRQIHGTALMIGPFTGVMLCTLVGLLLAGVYAPRSHDPSSPVIAAASIFTLTGVIIAGVLITGPSIMRYLLTGDRRPA